MRRRAGEQRVVPRAIVAGARPQHGAVLASHRQHPVEGTLHRRPQVVDECRDPRCTASGATRRWRCTRTRWCRAWPPRPCRRAGSSSTNCRRHAGCRRATRSRARRRAWKPATSSAIVVSTWFHGSQCPPGNHGIMPVSSCSEAIHSAVSTISSAEITPSRSGSCGMTVGPLGWSSWPYTM